MSWESFFAQPDVKAIREQVEKELEEEEKTYKVFPPANKRFRIFDELPWDQVKVVIIGQDPYIREGQAEGYSFSVPKPESDVKVKIPPSLRNMFKVLNITRKHGCLANWVDQGVMLLNMSLSVREGKSNSHQNLWKPFTNKLVQFMVENSKDKVRQRKSTFY